MGAFVHCGPGASMGGGGATAGKGQGLILGGGRSLGVLLSLVDAWPFRDWETLGDERVA